MSLFISRTLTLLTISVLGSAVLLAWFDIGLTRPKIENGKTYCSCSCKTKDYTGVDLIWAKVASCALNGRDCKAQIGNQLIPGKLEGCLQCTGDSDGGFSSCKTAKRLGIFTPPGLQIAPRIPRAPKWGRVVPRSSLTVK
jgi:hypothetical protein